MVYKLEQKEGTQQNNNTNGSAASSNANNNHTPALSDNNNAGKTKKNGGLSTTKLLAAACAAITASLITTRLTSYIGSVMIVGVSSMLIAIFSEFYSKVLKKTKKVSAKIAYNAIPYEKILPNRMSDKIDEKLVEAMQTTVAMQAITTEINKNADLTADNAKSNKLYQYDTKIVSEGIYDPNSTMFEDYGSSRLAKLVQSTPDNREEIDTAYLKRFKDEDKNNYDFLSDELNEPSHKTASYDNEQLNNENTIATIAEKTVAISNTPDEHAEHMIESAKTNDDNHETNNDSDEVSQNGIIPKIKGFINKLALTPFTKSILLFLAIAMITSAMSYLITTYVDKPNVTNITVQETKVQQLSDEEKNAIKQQVKSEVSNQIANAQNDADNAENNINNMNKQIDEMQKQLTNLQNTVNKTNDANSNDSSSDANNNDNDYSSEITSLKQQIGSLQTEINNLQNEITNLKSQSNNQTSGNANNNQ